MNFQVNGYVCIFTSIRLYATVERPWWLVTSQEGFWSKCLYLLTAGVSCQTCTLIINRAGYTLYSSIEFFLGWYNSLYFFSFINFFSKVIVSQLSICFFSCFYPLAYLCVYLAYMLHFVYNLNLYNYFHVFWYG